MLRDGAAADAGAVVGGVAIEVAYDHQRAEETAAKAAVAKAGSFNPMDAKNFTNSAKKSLPTQRCCTSGRILSATLRPQNRVQNHRMAP